MAKPRTSSPAINQYALYGELLATPDPEFVHIEDISARSLLYEWRIRPHTHQGMFQLVCLRTGRVTVWIDEASRETVAPCVVVVPSGVVHGFEFEPDTAGQVVTVADTLLSERGARQRFQNISLAARVVDFADDPEQFRRIEANLDLLAQEFLQPQAGRAAMLEWLFRALLLSVRRRIDLQQLQDRSQGGRHASFSTFLKLIEEHYAEHWAIADYARALALTQPTLNRLCRLFAGKGALELVQDRLLMAARRHLIYTDASIEAIAYGLGFQDPAYFCRFFKRRAGQAPSQFRQRQTAG